MTIPGYVCELCHMTKSSTLQSSLENACPDSKHVLRHMAWNPWRRTLSSSSETSADTCSNMRNGHSVVYTQQSWPIRETAAYCSSPRNIDACKPPNPTHTRRSLQYVLQLTPTNTFFHIVSHYPLHSGQLEPSVL